MLIFSILLLPFCPTETKDTPDAPEAARKELQKLGPLSRDEKITAGAFAITVALWIGGASLGVNSVAAATVGLAILLVTGTRLGGQSSNGINRKLYDQIMLFL